MDNYLQMIFHNKDGTVLPGIKDYYWLQLLSEVGTDLQKWKTEKHFTSWLGLAPKQHHWGKIKKNYKSKGQPKAGLILLAKKAVVRKLAELYWKLFVKGLNYVEEGIKAY